MSIEDNTAGTWFSLGKEAYEHLHPNDAVGYFNRALKMDPTYLRAFTMRALAYEALLNGEAAEADFAAVRRMAPDSAESLFAQAMMEANSDEEAIEMLSRVIETDPQFAEAYVQRAIHFGQLDKVDEALADFAEALKLSSGNLRVYEDRHEVFALANDYKSAIQDLRTLMDGLGRRPPSLCLQVAHYYSRLDEDDWF